jgi:hypothetical protein
MKLTIGTTVLAAGTLAGEPCRCVGGSGTKAVQTSQRIRAEKAAVFGRGNRVYVDVFEADYSYDTADLAQAAFFTLRAAALTATGNLIYGDGEAAVTVGPGECRSAELVEWIACGLTMRYEIVCVEA